MSINRINNTLLRRTVLVTTLLPLVLLNVIWCAWDCGLKELGDLPGAVASAWRGDR